MLSELRTSLATLLRRVARALDPRQETMAGQLRDQMALVQAILERTPGAIFLKDPQGRYTMVNPGWTEMSGFPAEAAIGKTVHDLYPPEVARRFSEEDAALLGNPDAPPVEAVHQGPRPGQWRMVRKALLKREDGSIQGLVSTSTDISALKRIEVELADRARFVSELVDAMPISVAMRDLEGRYVLVNRAWEEYFGVPRQAALGRRRRELPGWQSDPQRLQDAEEVEALDRAFLARGPGYVAPAEEVQRFGRHYLVSRRVLADASGAALGVLSAGVDMTERRSMEQVLELEKRRLDLVVRAAKVGTLDWDGRTRTAYYSPRFLEILGYPPDTDTSAWANAFETLVHPEDRERVQSAFRSHILDAGSERHPPIEYRVRRADGAYVWVEAQGVSVRDETGFATRFIASYTDITERRAQEEALRNQVKFINDLFDSVPLSLAMRDPAGRFLLVNRTWETYTGRKREEVLGQPLLAHMPKEEADAILAEDRAALGRGPQAAAEITEYLFRGRHLMQTRTVMRDAQDRVLGVLVASLDTTERHAMEQALAFEQRRLDLVVRGARVGIVDWDGHTHATYYSPIFREILGHAPDADTSQWPDYFKVLIHPDDREGIARRWVSFIKGKGLEGRKGEFYDHEEYRLLRKDGTYAWVQVSGIAVRDEKGFVTRWIAAVTDITERRAQEEALRASVRLREEVERMSRHDLKTPINSVIAMSRLLREGGKLAREDEALLASIERAGFRIINMVNLSLDLFRMESGTYDFRPRSVDLADVARRVAEDLGGQAASKGVALHVEERDALPARAEELLCYSMLANLIKNAIEAAPDATRVTVTAEGRGDAALLHVHNEGMVPQAVRERFFDKYATSGKSAGLGLGTYSARLMARVQEGDIALSTHEADGTTISVRFRAAAERASPSTQAARERAAAPSPPLAPGRVLVVDDDEFNRMVMRRLLPTPPLEVDLAVNGRAALEAARKRWPDTVFLDLEMPVMDGYEAARKLRELERESGRPRCTIVAVSSNDEDAIVQRALAAGCDHYLVKPASREAMLRVLSGRAPLPSGAGPQAEASAVEVVELDPDLEASLPAFLQSRRQALDEMQPAIARGDRILFRRLAHRLAGSFSLYGFRWAAAQCRTLERDAAEGDPGELAARARAVREHLDHVVVKVAARPS